MSKKILILVLSSDMAPYDSLMQTQMNTWDSVQYENIETVYYCAQSEKQNTDKVIYLPVDGSLNSVTMKTYLALKWALENKEFDYIARVHSCIYVNKTELAKYVEALPVNDVFATLKVEVENGQPWGWGGCGTVISKDVVKKLVDNKALWDFTKMEDMGMSYVINQLQIPYTNLRGCSIDKKPEGWLALCYGTESYEFKDFSELRKDGQFYFRTKQDGQRDQDEMIMQELFKNLNQ